MQTTRNGSVRWNSLLLIDSKLEFEKRSFRNSDFLELLLRLLLRFYESSLLKALVHIGSLLLEQPTSISAPPPECVHLPLRAAGSISHVALYAHFWFSVMFFNDIFNLWSLSVTNNWYLFSFCRCTGMKVQKVQKKSKEKTSL